MGICLVEREGERMMEVFELGCIGMILLRWPELVVFDVL